MYHKYIKEASGLEKAELVYSLRFVDDNEADEIINKHLSNDPNKWVRLEAAKALILRKPSQEYIDMQVQRMIEDKSALVRSALLNYLKKFQKDFPKILPGIKQLSERDSNPDVKKAARYFLASVVTMP